MGGTPLGGTPLGGTPLYTGFQIGDQAEGALVAGFRRFSHQLLH